MRLRSDSYFRYYSTSDRVDLENKKNQRKGPLYYCVISKNALLLNFSLHFSSESIQVKLQTTFIPITPDIKKQKNQTGRKNRFLADFF